MGNRGARAFGGCLDRPKGSLDCSTLCQEHTQLLGPCRYHVRAIIISGAGFYTDAYGKCACEAFNEGSTAGARCFLLLAAQLWVLLLLFAAEARRPPLPCLVSLSCGFICDACCFPAAADADLFIISLVTPMIGVVYYPELGGKLPRSAR